MSIEQIMNEIDFWTKELDDYIIEESFDEKLMYQLEMLVYELFTNHLDLENITSVNKVLEKLSGVLVFDSHDHDMIQTLANRIIELTLGGIMDRKLLLMSIQKIRIYKNN